MGVGVSVSRPKCPRKCPQIIDRGEEGGAAEAEQTEDDGLQNT